jgi:hypothetical protein
MEFDDVTLAFIERVKFEGMLHISYRLTITDVCPALLSAELIRAQRQLKKDDGEEGEDNATTTTSEDEDAGKSHSFLPWNNEFLNVCHTNMNHKAQQTRLSSKSRRVLKVDARARSSLLEDQTRMMRASLVVVDGKMTLQ